jgi:hypothetical protein
MSPGELLDLPIDGMPVDRIHQAWATAATIQHNRSWALALCRIRRFDRVIYAGRQDEIQREAARLLTSARCHPQYGFNRVSMQLTGLAPYWRGELAHALLDLLVDHTISAGASHCGMLWDFAALRLHPAHLEHLDRRLGELSPALPGYHRLVELAEALRYRRELRPRLTRSTE